MQVGVRISDYPKSIACLNSQSVVPCEPPFHSRRVTDLSLCFLCLDKLQNTKPLGILQEESDEPQLRTFTRKSYMVPAYPGLGVLLGVFN